MSKEKEHIIDKIGDKLREGEIASPANEWAQITRRLKFWDFFIPKFSTFNIYYLTAILTATSITTHAIIQANKKSEKEEEKPAI